MRNVLLLVAGLLSSFVAEADIPNNPRITNLKIIGTTYSSPNEVTVPRGMITQFAGLRGFQNGLVVPFGTFTFIRLD
jgi:hypothetical protein